MSTQLADAIIYNETEKVEALLKKGADVNELDPYGYTPLIEAAIANNLSMAQLLLQHRAKINGTDLLGSTALFWAAENNNIPLSKLLLANGADANAYTTYGQPVLVKPLMRRQHDLKELLYQHGASLTFAQDYIQTKLLGHRFELKGRNNILDHKGKFIEIDLEGFILEFTLAIILDSLSQFKNNFAARGMRDYFDDIQAIIDAFNVAGELIKYQQYMIDLNKYHERIDKIIEHSELLLIPMGYEGHAITFIKLGNLWAKCDRGENSKTEPAVSISRIRNPHAPNKDFIKFLLYKKHNRRFVNQEINKMLDLEPLTTLPLSSQITGNCSWANIEASIPTMFFMLLFNNKKSSARISELSEKAMAFYFQWREWDKDRALHETIENFYFASPARKACIAALLAAVLFQTCRYDHDKDLPRINKILAIFSSFKEYTYILKSYLKIYTQEHKTNLGNNLVQILDIAGS